MIIGGHQFFNLQSPESCKTMVLPLCFYIFALSKPLVSRVVSGEASLLGDLGAELSKQY